MRPTLCDQCGNQVSEFKWFHLEREGHVIRISEHPGPWDFCSLNHLHTWTADRAEQ